jgi:hypothetical protein
LFASASNAEATEPLLAAFRALESGDVAALESLLRGLRKNAAPLEILS